MKSANHSLQRSVTFLAWAIAAALPVATLAAPQQPARAAATPPASEAAPQQGAKTAAKPAASEAAPHSGWQSAVGEWAGAPCRIIVQKDDGKTFEADCFTPQGLHHPFHGTYTSASMIEGTVTRTDPSGCQVPVPMSIHLTDANHAEYSHPGFTGCGVNNAGPATNWPIRRAQPVAISSANNAAPQAQQQKTARSSATTASKTAAAKTEAQESKKPEAIRTAAVAAPKPKAAAPAKPAVKVPVELPIKSAN